MVVGIPMLILDDLASMLAKKHGVAPESIITGGSPKD